MRFLITRISEAFKEVNLEDLESEIRDYGLRAMKEAIELVMNNQVDQYLEGAGWAGVCVRGLAH